MIDEKKLAELFVERAWSAHGYEMLTTIDALLKIARAAQRVREHRRLWYPFRMEERELLRDELDKALDALNPVDKKENP